MAKTLKALLQKTIENPSVRAIHAGKEKEFAGKHKVLKTDDPYGNDDKIFKGGKVSPRPGKSATPESSPVDGHGGRVGPADVNKEETVNEVSKALLDRYVSKAAEWSNKNVGKGKLGKTLGKAIKRSDYVQKATDKLYKEEETLVEISTRLASRHFKGRAIVKAPVKEPVVKEERLIPLDESKKSFASLDDSHESHRTRLVHGVTEYDRKQEEKSKKNPRAHYNHYALAQYLNAADRAHEHIKKGVHPAEAINHEFNGSLANHLHKRLGTGGVDIDTHRKRQADARIASLMKKEETKAINEARKAIPLKGHAYHEKSDDELHYIMKDAHDAAENMKGWNAHSEAKYLDQVNDAATVLHHRRHGGKRIVPPHHHGNMPIFTHEERIITESMSPEAHELVLHADNDSTLHRQSHKPIMDNLKKKVKKGVYDSTKATKLWKYHADRAAHSYAKEHGSQGGKDWHKMFTPAHRKEAAAHWEAHHKDELHEETTVSEGLLGKLFGKKKTLDAGKLARMHTMQKQMRNGMPESKPTRNSVGIKKEEQELEESPVSDIEQAISSKPKPTKAQTEKAINKAIARHKKKVTKEETDLVEVSNKLLGRYIKKASKSASNLSYDAGYSHDIKTASHKLKKAGVRNNHIEKATRKIVDGKYHTFEETVTEAKFNAATLKGAKKPKMKFNSKRITKEDLMHDSSN